jgi:hypothetical protein
MKSTLVFFFFYFFEKTLVFFSNVQILSSVELPCSMDVYALDTVLMTRAINECAWGSSEAYHA